MFFVFSGSKDHLGQCLKPWSFAIYTWGLLGLYYPVVLGLFMGYFIGLTNQDFMECHHIHGFC